MSAFHANLRLFAERSILWVIYACMVCMLILLILLGSMSVSGAWHMVRLLLLVVPIGHLVGGMQVEVLSCPFALTLPGYRAVARRVVFLVGLVVSLVVMLLVLPGSLAADHLILTLSAAFVAALALYLSCVAFTYLVALPVSSATTLVLLMLAVVALMALPEDGQRAMPDLALQAILMTGVLITALVWWYLGRPAWQPRAHFSMSGWWARWARRDREADGQYVPSASGRFMLDLIRGGGRASAAKYVWGALYAWLAPGGGGRRQLIVMFGLALGCAVYDWYVPVWGFWMLFGTAPLYDLSRQSLYSRLLVAGGRRERFFATLALFMVLNMVWTVSAALSFATVDFLGPYLLQSWEITRDFGERFGRTNIRLVVFVTVLYPLQLLIGGGTLFPQMLRRLVAGMVFLLFVLPPIVFMRLRLNDIPLVYVPLTFIAVWLICAYALHGVIMRRDLVPPRRDNEDLSWLQVRRRMKNLREQVG